MDTRGIVRGLRWAGGLSAAGALAFTGVLLVPAPALVLGMHAAALGAVLAPMPAAFRALLPPVWLVGGQSVVTQSRGGLPTAAP